MFTGNEIDYRIVKNECDEDRRRADQERRALAVKSEQAFDPIDQPSSARKVKVLVVIIAAVIVLIAALAIPLVTNAEDDSDMFHALQFVADSLNDQSLDAIDTYVAPDWVLHDPQAGYRQGRHGYLAWITSYRVLMPDVVFMVDDKLKIDDMWSLVWTLEGAHTGTTPTIPASGNHVCLRGMLFLQIADGQIVESWITYDNMRFLDQLGVWADPECAPTTGDNQPGPVGCL